MSGAGSSVSDVRCWISVLRCQLTYAWCLMSDRWSATVHYVAVLPTLFDFDLAKSLITHLQTVVLGLSCLSVFRQLALLR